MPGLEDIFKLSEQGVLGIFVVILVGFVYFLLQRLTVLTNQILESQEKRITERDEFVRRALEIRHNVQEEIKRSNEELKKSHELARLEGFHEALGLKEKMQQKEEDNDS